MFLQFEGYVSQGTYFTICEQFLNALQRRIRSFQLSSLDVQQGGWIITGSGRASAIPHPHRPTRFDTKPPCGITNCGWKQLSILDGALPKVARRWRALAGACSVQTHC